MQKIRIFSVIGLTTFAIQMLFISAVHAAIPEGSYTQTCRNVYTNGDTLSATCQTANGRWKRTELQSFSRCVSDISNQNGNLRCEFVYIPEGSYKQTCQRITPIDDTLTAICRKIDGGWMETRLENYRHCRNGSVDNLDGLLVCDRQ
ncbi:MAG TPA: hypothetical protein DEG17_09100 [Cyanobacteria bacterium UBA11149]|nr:hypothetical protein [Cyanobacteria bacterium UBA11367]HBE60760.1 hypothetical protein [Cyanobacteria bacterium UBA11366]HBK66819.1 hypothetical protein [Cyanobacteria bacterium UBA11166]HBR72809.1 hypothetical protein [Cyanobacteria bacterium UBA11159]HBS68213.1 hypothetical protein [Cyanobacteria bacterium UBA11153]HBW89010.1 hypothetical protein [Cyanobacteria bacterium UBA11149]HCA95131.1 hypothetical protein [Cyanobacteria bacterium UBA9226]